MKEKLCATAWQLNFAELILSQMSKTVELMQQQVDLKLPDHLKALYKEKPYLQFAYFLAIYTQQLTDESQTEDFEQKVAQRVAQMPTATIKLELDGSWTGKMAVCSYSGAWQLFGTSRIVFTVLTETQLRVNLATPEGFEIVGNQMQGELLAGFKSSLPLAIPTHQNLPITWRFELDEHSAERVFISTLSENKTEAEAPTQLLLHAVAL
jgi:hypothetical protein